MAGGIICHVTIVFRGISICKCSLQITKQYRENTLRVDKSNRLSVLCVPVYFILRELQDLTQLSLRWFWSVVLGFKCCSLARWISVLSLDCAVVPQNISVRVQHLIVVLFGFWSVTKLHYTCTSLFVNQCRGIAVLKEIPSCSGQMLFALGFINKTRI